MKARSWATGASTLSTPTVSSKSACSQHPRPTHLLTRVAGADVALLLPRRRPRTSTALRSTRLPEPSRRPGPALPSATLHSPDCQSKEQHQPGAADATENSRQRRRARRAPANPAAAAPAASLPPLPPSKPCAEAADLPAAGLREAVALPPGLDAASTKRRVQGSRGVPIEWTSLG